MAGNISPVPGSESQHVCVCSVTSVMSDPMDSSPPGSFVHGILQARMLEWAAMPFVLGIFPTQGLNPGFPCLLHWQVDSLALSHVGPDVYCLPKLLLVLPSAG